MMNMDIDSLLGRYDNISIDEYHKLPGFSKSTLDYVNRSMAHYLHSLNEHKQQTAAMRLGSAFHCLVLTPDMFNQCFAIPPDVDRRTSAGKAEYEQFLAVAAGKTMIAQDEFATAKAMADSILSHPVASKILIDGDAEHSFFWQDKRSKLKCKCRPDFLRRDGDIVDLKSTSDAEYFAFQKSIVNYRYHVQGAFFIDGVSDVLNTPLKNFILIAVENKAPYAVAIYRLDSDAINVGRTAYRENLSRVSEFFANKDAWPGYPTFISDMALPAWAN